ncbi:Gfo/Idh/MocA family oxidoreductase [Paenibacillus mucilaginosus]|uniref:Oxidoreductase domain protein n=1 Tax=Paenibacillus mucilaginosus (strain KNP414) TaxID=1036673 RepID=F8FHL2_PAEMK|nr:Gfo/Idh/MocA family oxidoreductase [Paenibacillus mucilaginosus]AEI42320.1 oxidoreductase domain protein [Paenibacillus mucilaginosus KNP414]MCG7214276.1 Gfo/Idh/MocA family oxidoreductase [Paenibacillus mucilaginosus]WDM28785.1 Gfo/Idh/MocA family oxidoreductase [Paenibacillus mucilaginosus]
MGAKKTYVLVGSGGRAEFYWSAIATQFKETSELLAFCDTNETRMNYANKRLTEVYGAAAVPAYKAEDFDRMIREVKPDTVIVTTVDRTHHTYIIRALELGCDVITEKPMTVDEDKCQAILDAVERTGRRVRVTFNYRYAPHHTKARELIASGTIGDVFSVHFEWLLNHKHGADYFRRWHRDKRNSGGLLVHKSTHHFDLVNFWIGSRPDTVFAFGDLLFYGKENAERRGETRFYDRATANPLAEDDPFALHLDRNENLKAMYLDAEHEDGYRRDQSVFGDGISIEDTMGVMVRYKNNAILTYSLNAYLPWEGYRIAFNGSKGRIEMSVGEKSYVNSGGDKAQEGAVKSRSIRVFPMFGKPYEVEVELAAGGHGGGDPALLNDLFGEPAEDPFRRAADHVDGARSILTGIAANRSIRTGLPVRVDDLVRI